MSHIKSATDDDVSWCGEPLGTIEPYFRSLDQAAMNGMFPSNRKTCRECVDISVKSLLNNLNEDDSDE